MMNPMGRMGRSDFGKRDEFLNTRVIFIVPLCDHIVAQVELWDLRTGSLAMRSDAGQHSPDWLCP